MKDWVKIQNLLYVGDTIYDIRAAKEAEVLSAGISGPPGNQRGYHSKEKLEKEEPDFLFMYLFDILDIVKEEEK